MIRLVFSLLAAVVLAAPPAVAQPTDFVFAVTEGVTYQATPEGHPRQVRAAGAI